MRGGSGPGQLHSVQHYRSAVEREVRWADGAVCDDDERDRCASAASGDNQCGAGGEGVECHVVGGWADGTPSSGAKKRARVWLAGWAVLLGAAV